MLTKNAKVSLYHQPTDVKKISKYSLFNRTSCRLDIGCKISKHTAWIDNFDLLCLNCR